MGRRRILAPVPANTALATAGAMGGKLVSPMPPMGDPVSLWIEKQIQRDTLLVSGSKVLLHQVGDFLFKGDPEGDSLHLLLQTSPAWQGMDHIRTPILTHCQDVQGSQAFKESQIGRHQVGFLVDLVKHLQVLFDSFPELFIGQALVKIVL